MWDWPWMRRHIGPIGLDIGHDSIKMLQLRGDAKGLSVHGLQKRYRRVSGSEQTERQGLVLTIREMLEEGDFYGTEATLCVANDKLKITSVRLPESDVTQTAAQVCKEAAFRFGLDPSRDSIRYIPAGLVHQGDQIKQEMIVFAADHGATEECLALADETGLTAVGLGSVPCALMHGFEQALRRDEDKTGTLVFVDVGYRSTTVVFGRGGEICFAKVIPTGVERFNQEVAVKLGVEVEEAETLRRTRQTAEGDDVTVPVRPADGEREGDEMALACVGGRRPLDPAVHQMLTDAVRTVAEDLAREVCLCARYYTVTFRGHRVTRVIVSGGGAYEPVLCALLQAQLGADLERARPWRGLSNAPDMRDDPSQGCEWAVAFGLALKGWPTGRSQAASAGSGPALTPVPRPPTEVSL